MSSGGRILAVLGAVAAIATPALIGLRAAPQGDFDARNHYDKSEYMR